MFEEPALRVGRPLEQALSGTVLIGSSATGNAANSNCYRDLRIDWGYA